MSLVGFEFLFFFFVREVRKMGLFVIIFFVFIIMFVFVMMWYFSGEVVFFIMLGIVGFVFFWDFLFNGG